jgi:hypothetical protein
LLHPEPLQHFNHFVGFGSTHYRELLAVIYLIVVDFHLQASPFLELILDDILHIGCVSSDLLL